jgi:hypothetical protein
MQTTDALTDMPPESDESHPAVMRWRLTQLEKLVASKLDDILKEIRESKRSHEAQTAELNTRITSLETDRAKAVGAGLLAKILIGLCSSGVIGMAFTLWKLVQSLPPAH